MQISFITINRILENKAAEDEEIREQLQANGRGLLSHGRALSDEALLARLASQGLHFIREQFLTSSRDYLSAEEMARAVYALRQGQPRKPGEDDWVWVAFACLWERWSPERPSFEMIDDRMQEGYRAEHERDTARACRLWLETWQWLWRVVEERQVRSLAELDHLFRGTNLVFNWVSDFSIALHNAGLDDRSFWEERRAFLETFLRFHRDSNLSHLQNDLGETYFALGMAEKGEQFYRHLLQENPRWGWGWIGWADCYFWDARDRPKDPTRAEQILKQGLAVSDVEDRKWLLDRLADLYQETGRGQEAEAIRAAASRPEPPVASPPARKPGRPPAKVPPDPAKTQFRLTAPAGQPAQVGRNDPCPCGSGKKYKHCCLRK